jgi:putative transcriptional regulator
MGTVNLTQHFLIAMPNMADPNFARSLTFICEHNDQGALGLVVNRPTELTLSKLLEQVNINTRDERCASLPIHFGGPVQVDRGFVLHRPLGQWQSTLAVGDIGLTTSKDILEAAARGEGPDHMLITLGYAGWAPGQLESEIGQNAWLTVAASDDVIFETPAEERLGRAMKLLGIDFASLSETAGHA